MSEEIEKTEIKIEGMHCVSCERTITQALKKVPGVLEAQVNFVGGEAVTTSKSGEVDHKDLIKAIADTGYTAHLIAGADDEEIDKGEKLEDRIQLISLIISAILTLPLILAMIAHLFGFKSPITPWAEFILATIVQFGFGWRFYAGSYFAIKRWAANMDVLVCLGTTTAWAYSTVVLFLGLPYPLYFESSAAIITLVLLGRYLENRSRKKSGAAIKELVQLQPKTARKKIDEEWSEVPISEIDEGDVFHVRPGEKIPLDGMILEGSSYIDESMLTGESTPVKKEIEDKIFAATQNLYGSLIAKATAIGEKTALAQMIRLVKEAQNSKAPIQKLADQISAIFVPIVIVIALITFFLWWGFSKEISESLINAVAVLVIACPCALGMATPTVIMVATGWGARHGILIKNAEALQKARNIQILALDKTGTLTEGKPGVTEVISVSKLTENEILQLASSLEEHSEHPLSKAILTAYIGKKKKIDRFEAVTGKGIQGEIDHHLYLLGSIRWMKERGFNTDEQLGFDSQKGKTWIALANSSQILGFIGIQDPLRQHAKEVISDLHKEGIQVVLLTGDHYKTAQSIANEAGITDFRADVLPQDKVRIVRELKKNEKSVGMAGDGINDAPALAASDVSFAMRTGSDIAIESADITLMQSDLRAIPLAIVLSKQTFRKIKQNLFFAFIYNVLGIPLAAFGLLNPIIAGAAMAASSLCVVINALSLKPTRRNS